MARRRKSTRRRMPPRDPRTGLFKPRKNPSKRKGAKKGTAKRSTAKRTVAKRRGLFQKITGPRVTAVGGVRALKNRAGQGKGGTISLNNLQTGDRIRVIRHGKDAAHFDVGGVRPRDNPGKRRKKARKARKNPGKKRVIIRNKRGKVIRSFMARTNPSRRKARKTVRRTRRNPMPKRNRKGRFVRGR